MHENRIDSDRFKKNHILQKTFYEMVILHRAAAIFNDKGLASKLLNERERFHERFRLSDLEFILHIFP